MRKPIVFVLAFATALAACKKNSDNNPGGGSGGNETAIAPDGFNFQTSKEITVNVQLQANDGSAITGVPVNIYSIDHTNDGDALLTAYTNSSGSISAKINVPSYVDTLIVDPAYVGLIRNAKTVINGSTVNCIIGGANGYGGDVVANMNAAGDRLPLNGAGISVNQSTSKGGTVAYSYLGAYDYNGRPTTRATSDVISSQLLTFINTSLPEQRPVPTYHPDYLQTNAETNLNITALSDVWITFVSEGAGYYNSLGFYKYNTSTPPQTINDIDSIKVAIPNASLSGSGGTMRSGDKIYLGRFTAGTSIGFVLFQNAWNGYSVNTNATKFFADDNLNNETGDNKRHTVLLYDGTNKLFLIGFEDLYRSAGASDNDFNDLMFYASSNPVDAISTENVNPIDKPVDSDGDGVSDVYDKFPNDPTKAYINYFPSQTAWGTLAYEDLWPSTGDYDVNDLVVGYQYQYINNALNKTVEMKGRYIIRAAGATFQNGFGVQMPFTPDKISKITGMKRHDSYITNSANGTEANQSKAVFIPFDNAKALLSESSFVNVNSGAGFLVSDTADVTITFASAMTAAEIGVAPYNPFLIKNMQRAYEVHLPGNAPTSLADTKLFGTGNDNSSVAKNKYYLTSDNWPWALSFVENFDYPSEGNNISDAYLYFLSWAQTGGTTNTNWYTNTSGNRNDSKIYHH